MDYLEYKNYLMHHGIEGQKWGKRNGPPYPLDPEDHSAAEKKANGGDYSQGVKQDRGERKESSSNSERDQDDYDYEDELNDYYDNYDKEHRKEVAKKVLVGAGITAGVLSVAGATTIGVTLAVKEPQVFSNALDSVKDIAVNAAVKKTQEAKDAKIYKKTGMIDNDTYGNIMKDITDKVRSQKAEKYAARKEKFTDAYKRTTNFAKKAYDKVDKVTEKANDFTAKVTKPVNNANKAIRNVTGAIVGTTGTVAAAKKMYEKYEASQMGMTPQEYQQYKKQLQQQQREQYR